MIFNHSIMKGKGILGSAIHGSAVMLEHEHKHDL